jgi:glutaredoxin
VTRLELYGTARCPYTQEMREWLEWLGHDFVEYDVDADAIARKRLHELAAGQRSVPVLIEDNKVIQVGWQGRSCMMEVE